MEKIFQWENIYLIIDITRKGNKTFSVKMTKDYCAGQVTFALKEVREYYL